MRGADEMSSAQEMGQGREALSRAAGMVAEARGDFDRYNHELVQTIDSTRAVWAGQGARAFSSLGLAWSAKQRTITDALDRFETALLSTEKDNVSTDDAQSSVFARNQRRLG
jgi:uncharacterized protein YukE